MIDTIGPPGTGKTTTLKGLLNSLHLREYNRYYNAVLDVAQLPDDETAKAWARVGNEKPHILVCGSCVKKRCVTHKPTR